MVIDVDNFCKVNSKSLESAGIPKGSIVYVVGTSFLPEDGNDGYLFRKMLIVCSVDDETVYTNYTYARGDSLTPLSEEEQQELKDKHFNAMSD